MGVEKPAEIQQILYCDGMKKYILYLCFIFGFVACTTPFQSLGNSARPIGKQQSQRLVCGKLQCTL